MKLRPATLNQVTEWEFGTTAADGNASDQTDGLGGTDKSITAA
jgi:hypothetical protein